MRPIVYYGGFFVAIFLLIICGFANIFSISLLFKGGGFLTILAFVLSLSFSGALTFFSVLYAVRKKQDKYFIIKKMYFKDFV